MPIRGGIRYRPSPHQRPLFQGDILAGIPVAAMPPDKLRWILLRAPSTSNVSLDQLLKGQRPTAFIPRSEEAVVDAWAKSEEIVVARASKTPVILITQTCDIDWRNHFQVAPVKKAEQLSPAKLESLRNEEIQYLYYLPARPPELPDECYADLTQMTSVHKSYFKEAPIVTRFTDRERTYFQQALASFHGSPFGFATTDDVPEAGRYGCAGCFHSGFKTTIRVKNIGDKFPPCRRCGAQPLWVRLAE